MTTYLTTYHNLITGLDHLVWIPRPAAETTWLTVTNPAPAPTANFYINLEGASIHFLFTLYLTAYFHNPAHGFLSTALALALVDNVHWTYMSCPVLGGI